VAAERGSDIDLLLASLRADAADLHTFLQVLAVKLEDALPGHVQVQRHGGLFSHDKSVTRIALDLGEHQYSIGSDHHGQLHAQRQRIVRGIVLKTEDLSVDDWIRELVTELGQKAETSSQERAALERLLLGRSP
jgi:flagellar hook-associated protein FlgK